MWQNYFKPIFTGGWSLLTGMGVTFRYMFKTTVTVQYPKEKLEMTPRFRGPIQFVLDPKRNSHNCISCLLCEKVCPDNCYTIEGEKNEAEGGQKRPTKFIYNMLQCSLCSLCIQVCPTKTLEHSKKYELADYTKEGFLRVDFLTDIKERAEAEKG